MVTLENLCEILKTTGLPVAYLVFKTPQKPPYICYFVTNSNNKSADNVVWQKINHVQIELYTARKDREAEQKLEDALTSEGIFFESAETYIDSEKIYQKIYETEV